MVQVDVCWLIPGECTSNGVECGGFQRKVIAHTKALFTSSVGRYPVLIPRDKGVCGSPLQRRFRTP